MINNFFKIEKTGLNSYWDLIEKNLFQGEPSYRRIVDMLLEERKEYARKLKNNNGGEVLRGSRTGETF